MSETIECPVPDNDPEASKDLTVGMIKELLKNVSDDYLISFDSGMGYVAKRDFTIFHNKKTISING